jgi:hypothetical protein
LRYWNDKTFSNPKKKIMKKQCISLRFPMTWSMLPLLLLLFLSSACQKEGPFPWDKPKLEPSPIRLGTYLIKDVYQGRESTYEMSVRRLGDYFEFCNFAGLRLSVKAYVQDKQISIPAQQILLEDPVYLDFEIFQGMGKVTANGLEMTVWTREGTQESKHEMKAVFLN